MNKANKADMVAALAGKANMQQPTLYNLQLSAGIKKYLDCYYYITEDREVGVVLSVTSTSGAMIPSETVLSVLPAGFRPRAALENSCAADYGGYKAGIINVQPNGSLIFKTMQGASHIHTAAIKFLAAN